MTSQLGNKIMAEIGLESHYLDLNGTVTCKYIRVKAAKQLEAAIERNHTFHPKAISEPKQDLIQLVQLISENEAPDSILTKTWEVASEVIGVHIRTASISNEEREKAYERIKAELTREYSKYLKPNSNKNRSNIEYR